MLLKHEDLRAAMFDRGLADALVLTPLFEQSQIGPASLDVRLGTEFLALRRTVEPGLDPTKHEQADLYAKYDRLLVRLGESIWLHPGHFVLASTLEYLRLPDDLGAYVVGRSSWGRVGLIVATAIMVQPGFTGSLTLELVNDGDSPIRLFPGARIAQLAIHSLNQATAHTYGPEGKYQAPIGPTPSLLRKEAREIAQLEAVKTRLDQRLAAAAKK